MAVPPGDVRRYADLARLSLDADEVARLAAELSRILAHVERLAAVPIDGSAERDAGADAPADFRPDAPGADPLQTPLDAFAPGWDAPFFAVPLVPGMEGGEEPA